MRKYCLALCAALLTIAGSAGAAEFQPLGTLGIGGAGVARQNGALTAYWNPAAGAFNDKTLVFVTGAQAGVRGNNGLAENVDALSDIDFNNLKNFGSNPSPDVLANTVKLISILNDIDRRKGNVALTASAPVGFAVKHFSFGVFGNIEGYAQPLPDTLHILPTTSGTGSSAVTTTTLLTAAQRDPNANNSTIGYFSQTERAAIISSLTGGTSTLTQAQATQIVNSIEGQMASSGVPADQAASAASSLATAVTSPASAGDTIDKNTTSVMTKALLYVEIPVAYGYPIDLGRFGKLGIGAALKAISGTVYQNQVLLVNRTDGNLRSQDLLKEITKNKKTSTDFGIDLGALWKYENVSVGIVAKNLNSPSFEAPVFQAPVAGAPSLTTPVRGSDVTLDPQARLGVAYDPLQWLTVAADLDLTENDAVVPSSAVKSRNLGGGVEFHPYWWLKFRLGAYKNLADSDTGPVGTFGLSLGPFDLDAAASFDTFHVGGNSVPDEVKVQLLGGFSF